MALLLLYPVCLSVSVSVSVSVIASTVSLLACEININVDFI